MRFGIVVTALGLVTGAIAAVAQPARTGVTTDAACSTFEPHLTAAQRLQGSNRSRLLAVQAMLAPGFSPGSAEDGLHMLADYQEEMERVQPDATAAAVYLASVSTVPVTLRLLQAVNATLCVAASQRTATTVAALAEATRKDMAR